MDIIPIVKKTRSIEVFNFNDLSAGDKFICTFCQENSMPLNHFKALIKHNPEVYIRVSDKNFDGAVSIITGISYSLEEAKIGHYKMIKVNIK